MKFLYLYEWKAFYHLDRGPLKVGVAKKMNKVQVQEGLSVMCSRTDQGTGALQL